MIPFAIQQTYASSYATFADPNQFHSTGTSAMSFGPTIFPVTTYEANTIPETLATCGTSYTINAFTLQVGTPPGASGPFITLLHLAGTVNNNGQNTQEDFTFKLVSITVA